MCVSKEVGKYIYTYTRTPVLQVYKPYIFIYLQSNRFRYTYRIIYVLPLKWNLGRFDVSTSGIDQRDKFGFFYVLLLWVIRIARIGT